MLRKAVHNEYLCYGKYACGERAYCRFCDGTNSANDCVDSCFAEEFSLGFMAGWDACLKHLGDIPWNKAIDEIVESVKGNK